MKFQLCISCYSTTCLDPDCRFPDCQADCWQQVVMGEGVDFVICQDCVRAQMKKDKSGNTRHKE